MSAVSEGRPPRVRFAPAPSGVLHVGSVRTALFNWLHARHHDGVFIFRLEDTDEERANEESVRSMTEAMRWLGLDWDEGVEVGGPYGPYRQSERAGLHRAVARRLVEVGHAYEDWATAEELEAFRASARGSGRPPIVKGPVRGEPRPGELGDPAVRLRTPESGRTDFTDVVRGDISFDWADVGDFVILRANGSPTYPLANSVDDVAQGVTLVCRGEDLLSVTPRQRLLYDLLVTDGLLDEALDEAGLPARDPSWGPPSAFAHLSIIVGEDRQKLSKRHGSVAVQEFARQGFLPEVILNYVALLGWAPGDGRERLHLDELIEAFDLGHASRTSAMFDVDKMTAFNGERIRDLTEEELAEQLVPHLDGTYGDALISSPPTEDETALLRGLVPLVQERMQRLDEVQVYAPAFFREDVVLDEQSVDKVLGKDGATEALAAAREALAGLDDWSDAAIEGALRALPERLGMGARKVFQPVRVAATGSSVSPPLFESLALMPRDRVLDRIDRAIAVAAS